MRFINKRRTSVTRVPVQIDPTPGSVDRTRNASAISTRIAPGAAGRFIDHHRAARRISEAARVEILTRSATASAVPLQGFQQFFSRDVIAGLDLFYRRK